MIKIENENIAIRTADPTALGLFGLAMVTLVASSQKLGITSGTSLLLPWVIFLGAFAQLFACINDSKRNNAFGTTAFGGYALFWFGIGATWIIKLGGFGESFMVKMDSAQLGIAFVGYFIFSAYMTIGSAKVSKILFAIFVFIDVLFVSLVLSTFSIGEPISQLIAGLSELVISILSFYASAASILNTHFEKVVLPVGLPFAGKKKYYETNNIRNIQRVAKRNEEEEVELEEEEKISKSESNYQQIIIPEDKEDDFVTLEISDSNDISEGIPLETIPEQSCLENSLSPKNLLSDIVNSAYEKKAQDIYLSESHGKVAIRYKIDGRIFNEETIICNNYDSLVSQIMGNIIFTHDTGEAVSKGFIEICISKENLIKLSVRILNGLGSKNFVLSFTSEKKQVFRVNTIGMNNEKLQILRDMLKLGSGIIFISSEDEFQRKALYYSILNEIATLESNIVSFEKTIYEKLPNVTQLELKDFDTSMIENAVENVGDFGFEAIAIDFEPSPKIYETLENFASKGKFVFITTKDSSAYETLASVKDVTIGNSNILSLTRGVIAQKSLMEICRNCNHIMMTFNSEVKQCHACQEKSNIDRVFLFETILLTPEILQMFSQKSGIKKAREAISREKGSYENSMRSIVQNLGVVC